MEAGELIIATSLLCVFVWMVLINGSPDLLDAMIYYLMNANIITVI